MFLGSTLLSSRYLLIFALILVSRVAMSLFTVSKLHFKDCWIPFVRKFIIPPLTYSTHKGQHGRIGVVGGSVEYSGAPYYAAESALRFGCDLLFVFCAKQASVPIKSYSPEFMVTPFYDADTLEDYRSEPSTLTLPVVSTFNRLHSLAIGPGLGRNNIVLGAVSHIISQARAINLPLVIDADGLWLVTQNLSLIKNYPRCILTPNAVEFDRLIAAALIEIAASTCTSSTNNDCDFRLAKGSPKLMANQISKSLDPSIDSNQSLCCDKSFDRHMHETISSANSNHAADDHDDDDDDDDAVGMNRRDSASSPSTDETLFVADVCDMLASSDDSIKLAGLSRYLGVTILRKGSTDMVSSGDGHVYVLDSPGSPRRCGGQGDIVAGCTAVALHWANKALEEMESFSLVDLHSETHNHIVAQPPREVFAAAMASIVVRRASVLAFQAKHRSMTSVDVLSFVGQAFYELYDVDMEINQEC